jgi:hypothetical protein
LVVWGCFINSLIDNFTIQRLSGVILGYFALEVKGFKKFSRLVYLIAVFGFFLINVSFSAQDFNFFQKEVAAVNQTPVLVIGGSSYVGHRVK